MGLSYKRIVKQSKHQFIMKSLFYFLFGIVCALFSFAVLFADYSATIMDDFYLELLHNVYEQEYYYFNIIVSTLFISFVMVWGYNLGSGTKEKERLIANEHTKENTETP